MNIIKLTEDMKMADKNERFILTYKQGVASRTEIIVDKLTGVNYLFRVESGYAGGLTPLLDKDGKPVITPMPNA